MSSQFIWHCFCWVRATRVELDVGVWFVRRSVILGQGANLSHGFSRMLGVVSFRSFVTRQLIWRSFGLILFLPRFRRHSIHVMTRIVVCKGLRQWQRGHFTKTREKPLGQAVPAKSRGGHGVHVLQLRVGLKMGN